MSNRNDTYYVDRPDYEIVEAPNGGTDTVIASVSYTLPANVEIIRLVGAGLTATGNSLNNTLYADETNVSTLIGGLGNDTYYVFKSDDVVIEDNNLGSDTIISTASYDLGTLSIERLTLAGDADIDGIGRERADRLYGNSGRNTLTGLGGDDLLDGGAGADTMIGGTGNDTYYVDHIGDRVIEAQGSAQGTNDIVYSSVGYGLAGQFIETVTLTGSGHVNAIGNSQSNTLNGNGGNNILYGGGGADTMVGGGGNDTYYVDSRDDRVIELQGRGNGNDTIVAEVSYDITGTFVENLVLAEARGFGIQAGGFWLAKVPDFPEGRSINGYGNAMNNIITGNSANNIIDGRAGADIMDGGYGSDTYYVDNAGDRVIENFFRVADENFDTVYASVSFDVGDQYIEKVVLTGTGNISATGNGESNELQGNSANNVLDGRGGIDTMTGGRGDDIYYVDNSRDQVIELQGVAEGNDTVYASASFSLAGTFVETLALTGAGDFSATGNAQANTLIGNAGDNVLTGGGGSDTFVFTGDFGQDRVTDFDTAADLIRFSPDTFTSYSQVLDGASQVGDDVVIAYDAENVVTLQGVTLESLEPDHFLFA